VAAFAIRDGRTRWRTPGSYVCTKLPCPGQSQAGYIAPDQNRAGPTVGVRAVERGILRSYPDATGTLSNDARVVLEGFAPADGHTVWHFDAGRDVGLLVRTQLPPQRDLHTLLVAGSDGQQVALDLATGVRSLTADPLPAWCRSYVEFRLRARYALPGRTRFRFFGQDALTPCDGRTRRPQPAPAQVPAWIGEIGARVGGVIAWSETNGVVAAPAG
jgi:hypothetical protein